MARPETALLNLLSGESPKNQWRACNFSHIFFFFFLRGHRERETRFPKSHSYQMTE